MKNIIIFLLMMIPVQFISRACGQDSLEYYMHLAGSKNPLVLQKFSEYKAALEKVPQVGSLSDPEFTAGVFVQPMELPEGSQVADFQLMQMFPWFGTLNAAKDEMSQMAKSKFEEFRAAQNDVFFDVQSTMYELYNIRKQKIIAEKNRQLLKSIERMTLVRYKSPTSGGSSSGPSMTPSPAGGTSGGSSSMQSMGSNQQSNQPQTGTAYSSDNSMEATSSGGLSDLYRIQIELGELSDYISSLETQEEALTVKFNSYIDRPRDSQISVMDTLVHDSLQMIPVFNDSVLKNNPMLEMIRYEEKAYEARKKMAARMGYPMWGIGVDYSLMKKNEMSESSMNGKDMIMPMVKLTLPLYRSKYNAQRNEAVLLKEASGMYYESTVNSLQSEYYQALQQYKDSKRRVKLYSSQSELSNRSLTLMITSYSASGGNLTDILRIRQQSLDYENKKTQAVADYFTAVAWLKKLMASINIDK